MMHNSFLLSELLTALSGQLLGKDIAFSRVNTDTRSIQPGDLFVALKGEHFDAHDFANKAVTAGASALVVDRELALDVPQLIVADTRVALGKIAEYNRSFFDGTLFAITGSSGKTTVKEMLAEILSGAGQVLATKGNLNNDIGVPLTLLRIAPSDQYAVIEMGASGPGEIAYSAGLSHPDIALISNAMGAHLEGFGSLQGVVEAKGEIYDGLSPTGTAVVNIDDPHANQWIQRVANKPLLTFGLDSKADINAIAIQILDDGCYSFVVVHGDTSEKVQLKVMGRHNVMNALAAVALTVAAGLPLSLAAAGLERFCAVKGRMCSLPGFNGARIIDDSYNANPGSVKAAIQALGELKGERIFVLGDMGELGPDAEEMHREVGLFAAEHNIDKLLTVGSLSKAAVEGFESSNNLATQQLAEHFIDQKGLVDRVLPRLHENMVVLVKGSRSAGMDKVVTRLTEKV
ncbi:UDP-N-acetylmuramoyl-tripeptide--D-alanyl-D-alanine ligase [Neptunomonas japonica]|uniref:UDP-N-acetylmuramoyl-tripeptide--D-alanyl-D- alanine ligase n=1 Tax=Neptunomonas japonica TaxID=417574 RepID=UPI000407C02A|nr:UDP-N-acetylmuramoyl-tripeptide--D-alanyl-D-alanine ligase [Neptunomonas japonica]